MRAGGLMAPLSLQRRLSLGLVFTLTFFLGAQWWVSSELIEQMLLDQVHQQLRADSELVLTSVQPQAPGFSLDESRLPVTYFQIFSGQYFSVKSGDTLETSRSLWDFEWPEPLAAPSIDTEPRQITGPDGQTLMQYARQYTRAGLQLQVTTARDISELQAGMARYKQANALLAIMALLVLLLAQRLLVLKALRPLKQLKSDLQRLQQGELATLDFHGPSEVQPVVNELNRLFSVLDLRLKRSREAMGNLAHGLKTRLARLNQMSSSASEEGGAQFSREVEQLSQEVARLIDRETQRLRIVGDIRPGKQVPLLPLLQSIASGCQKIHAQRNLEIVVDVPPQTRWQADPEDLFELFGNLLDNACKWARQRVVVSQPPGMSSLAISIADDGPGCPADMLGELTQRGVRADEHTPGSGLGLAIVQDIANGYNLHMDLISPGRLGGFEVILSPPKSL